MQMSVKLSVNMLDEMDVRHNKVMIKRIYRNRLGRHPQCPSSRVIISSSFTCSIIVEGARKKMGTVYVLTRFKYVNHFSLPAIIVVDGETAREDESVRFTQPSFFFSNNLCVYMPNRKTTVASSPFCASPWVAWGHRRTLYIKILARKAQKKLLLITGK